MTMSSRIHAAVAAAALVSISSAGAAPTSDTHSIERLVPPSPFHGVHGLAFDRNDVLYAGSVVGHSIYRVDTASGAVEAVIGPPDGMADDLVFLADGTMVWTAITQGVVRARTAEGPIRTLAKLTSINSIGVRKSDGRLFAAQVFGGDGLWELDPSGAKPPRNILKDLGGLNGFDIGPDGMLYGPLWFKHQVVRIDPDSGALTVIADGFATPAAANFDSKWNLYVLDTARGELVRVDIKSGAKRVVAKLSTSLDNLAIDSKDRIFVSNMADNGIQEVNPQTGAARQVVKGKLAIPVGIAAVPDGAQDTLYVADVFAFRRVDGRTGEVTDIARAHAADTPIEYPVSVTANDKHIVLVSSEGDVQRYDRRSARLQASWHGFHGVHGVVELPDGSLVLAEPASGKLTRMSGAERAQPDPVVDALAVPMGLAAAGPTSVYVTELAAGQVTLVDVASATKRVIATGLAMPQSIAVASDGSLVVVELGKKQLTRIDPKTGAAAVLARDLPIGIPHVTMTMAGVTVGAGDTIYLTSDVENSVWRLVPKRN